MLTGLDDGLELVGRCGGTTSDWGLAACVSENEAKVSRCNRREVLLSGEPEDLEPMRFVREADHAKIQMPQSATYRAYQGVSTPISAQRSETPWYLKQWR
jgi:hypothetical protein